MFSTGGVEQLLRDVGALGMLFRPLGAPSRPALQRLHESCQLLSLDASARAELLALLLGDTPAAGLLSEHESKLRLRMQAVGVFRLGVGEAAELLANVV